MPAKLQMFRNATHTFKESDIKENCEIVILQRETFIYLENGGILLQGELQEVKKDETG